MTSVDKEKKSRFKIAILGARLANKSLHGLRQLSEPLTVSK